MFNSREAEVNSQKILSCYQDQLNLSVSQATEIVKSEEREQVILGYTRSGKEIFLEEGFEKGYDINDYKDALYQHKINGTKEGQDYFREQYQSLIKSEANSKLNSTFDILGVEDTLEKGEGDRGGVIVGHTQSGKPIYQDSRHESHKKFSVQDHLDAVAYHKKNWEKFHEENHLKSAKEKGYVKPGEEVRKIGKTKSGKPIYSNPENEAHKDFTEDDHADALSAHQKSKEFRKYMKDNDYDPDERNPEDWKQDSKYEDKDHITHKLMHHYKKLQELSEQNDSKN